MNIPLLILVLVLTFSCSQDTPQLNKETSTADALKRIVAEHYQLTIPKQQTGLLILFPCFPCNAENTELEFDIVNLAAQNEVAVLMMNFSQRLWLSDAENAELERQISEAITKNNLNSNNIYIGGFSSGGNVSLLLANHLIKIESDIQPKGVFIVDSPIDLLGLYENAVDNITRNYSAVAVEESKWIVNTFDREFGNGDSSIARYEATSPFISKTNSTVNLTHLEDMQIRFYSEPDTAWWKKNRQTDYEGTNAFYIEKLAIELKKQYGDNAVEYIATKNKGYRNNGERHPHSWSIVDKQSLMDWMISGER
ncbi:MAG: hypothetical protein ACRBF0_22215 [Calditrichia bacterium]